MERLKKITTKTQRRLIFLISITLLGIFIPPVFTYIVFGNAPMYLLNWFLGITTMITFSLFMYIFMVLLVMLIDWIRCKNSNFDFFDYMDIIIKKIKIDKIKEFIN